MSDWDTRFLTLAAHVASWSKDPSTRTGAVIVDDSRRILAVGYNGFPRGMKDDPARYADRDFKYKHIVHCEINAILNCEHRPEGATLYTWPFGSCGDCAKVVAQSGIKRVVYPAMPKELAERWKESCDRARAIYEESGFEIKEIENV